VIVALLSDHPAAYGGYGQSVCYCSSRVGHLAALLAARAVNHSMKLSVRRRAVMLAGNWPWGLSTPSAPVMLQSLHYMGHVQTVPDHPSLLIVASILPTLFLPTTGRATQAFGLCFRYMLLPSENRQEYPSESSVTNSFYWAPETVWTIWRSVIP
jgi:hypothetical protein